MERAYWLAWSQIKDVGPVLIKRLHGRFGSLVLAWQAPPAELLAVDGIGLVTADRIGELRSQLKSFKTIQNFAAFQVKLYLMELITSNAPEQA